MLIDEVAFDMTLRWVLINAADFASISVVAVRSDYDVIN